MPITKKTTLAQMIHDFVHSDDPKFSNDSPEQRKKRAMGAYYSMHKESINEIFDSPNPDKAPKGYLKRLKQSVMGKTVTDKKTGKKYNPDVEFNKILNSPETKEQFARMKAEKGKGWPKSAAHESYSNEPYHRVGVTVSDPNSSSVSTRKETQLKTVRVKGYDLNSEDDAINKAKDHFKKRGYKVHDANYIEGYAISHNESLDESKMSEIHALVQTHVEPHIKAYKMGKMDADTLGDKVTDAHRKIADETGHPIDSIKKVVNDYVDGKLLESQILTFEDWLIESKELDNDSRGKLHELLTASHLNHLIHGKLAHADHFRDEKGRTPEEAHNILAEGLSHDDYQKAHHHARQAAETIHQHLQEHHPELLNKNHHTRVSWTSLKSDHEKLTGKKDEAHAGGADVMVSSHDPESGEVHHAAGYSLKIADNPVTTGQTGSKTTEQVLGMKSGSLQQHDDTHRQEVNNILKAHGHNTDKMSEAEKHRIFKTSRDHPTEEGKKLANDIRASSYKQAANKVKEIKKHLESKSDKEQKDRLREFVAPSHTYPTYQVATAPKKNITSIKNEKEELKDKQTKTGKLSYQQSEGLGNSLLVKNEYGKTMHRLEIRSKRPVGHSEVIVK